MPNERSPGPVSGAADPRSGRPRASEAARGRDLARDLGQDVGLGALIGATSASATGSLGVLLRDRQGRVVFANRTAAQALGFDDAGALAAVPPDRFAHRFVIEEPDGGTAPLAAFPGAPLFRGGSEPDRVLRFRDPLDGWERWVFVQTRPFGDPKAGIAVLSLLRDISADRRRESGARFLDEATSRLCRSLVRDRVLEHAPVVAVPRLCDECVIVERDGRGAFAPIAFYLPGPGGLAGARELVAGVAPLLTEVEMFGRALLVAPGEASGAGSNDGPGGAARGSLIVAPITRGRDVVGAILLGMAPDTKRCHHPTDLELAQQLGERVGMALGNAKLFEAEQHRSHRSEGAEAVARRALQQQQALLARFTDEVRAQLVPVAAALGRLGRLPAGPHSPLVPLLQQQTARLHQLAAAAAAAAARASASVVVRDHHAEHQRSGHRDANGGEHRPPLLGPPRR